MPDGNNAAPAQQGARVRELGPVLPTRHPLMSRRARV
jgi:hypothetical protein